MPDKAGLAMRIGNAKGVEVTVDGKAVPAHRWSICFASGVVLDPREILAASPGAAARNSAPRSDPSFAAAPGNALYGAAYRFP